MHQGASARHLTAHAVELALILEDALKQYKHPIVADFMVRNPVCAELWYPISYVRQQMLANSYSYLPVTKDGTWYLLSDTAIARYLGPELEGRDRIALLASTVGHVLTQIGLTATATYPATLSVKGALTAIACNPVLLIHRPDQPQELLGLVTAFDLLLLPGLARFCARHILPLRM